MKTPGSLQDLLPMKHVLELRYGRSRRYWDCSGDLQGRIEDALPGFECHKLDENGFHFQGNPDLGIRSAFFYWNRAGLDFTTPGVASKAEESASRYLEIVTSGLKIDRLTRVGERFFYLFETASEDIASDLLDETNLWSPSNNLKGFGEPSSNGSAFRLRVKDRRMVRIEVGSGSGIAMPNGATKSGVTFDIDIYERGGIASGEDLSTFLRENRRMLKENLHVVLRGHQ